MYLIINALDEVELVVELGWNYMKFHPNSTTNSTSFKSLTIRTVISLKWKGGIINENKHFY